MLGAFAHPAFAIVWTASTCALIGIAMYDTASGWLMTTFDLNAFDVSLLHTATTLPIFLFTLPAGAIADIVDPRRMIIAVSYAIAALMAIFAAVVGLDFVSPVLVALDDVCPQRGLVRQYARMAFDRAATCAEAGDSRGDGGA